MVAFGAFLSLVAFGVSGFLGVYVLGLNPRGSANRAFAILMLSFVLWDAFEAVERSLPPGTPPGTILPWVRGLWLSICLIPAALIHLGLSYPEASRWLRKGWVLPALYAPFLPWLYLILGTDLVVSGLSSNVFGPSARVGPAYPALAVVYAVWFYAAQILFVRAWLRVRKSQLRRMQGIVVTGLFVGTVPGGITEIFWPMLTAGDTRLGLGSLYTLTWSVFIAFAVARYRYLVIEPVVEARPPRPSKHELERGLNYLVLEHSRPVAMGAFRDIVSATPGLCVTALAPARVAARFGLERTPILWITASSYGERTVRPGSLDFELLHTVTKFLREHPGTAVLLDDLDYLAELNGFDAVARFVRRVTNQASASRGTAILAVGHGTFTPDRLAVLRGSVDHVLEILQGPGDVSVPDGDHVLLLVTAQEAPAALAAAGARGGLLLTTEHPAKAQRRFGPGYEILWLSEGGEPQARRIPPTSLDVEAKRAVAQHVAAHPGSDVVLAGAEQLALYNEFPAILGFVKDALDLAGLSRCRLFVTISPDALPPRQVALLARRFDAPSGAPSVRRTLPSGPSTGAPESRILYRGPVS